MTFSTKRGEVLLQTRLFRVERVAYDDPQGVKHTREIVRHPGAAVILPVLEDGRICLIRNFRVTAGEPLIEVPAGTLDPGETPLACAGRELQEETGYTAGDLRPCGWIFPSPGILDEKMHLFIATRLKTGTPERMAGEQITNLIVSLDDALKMIESGELRDGKSIVLLLRYARQQRVGVTKSPGESA
jgi:ADP-ribose pyrophosphatase